METILELAKNPIVILQIVFLVAKLLGVKMAWIWVLSPSFIAIFVPVIAWLIYKLIKIIQNAKSK